MSGKMPHPLAWGSLDGPKQDTHSPAYKLAREREKKNRIIEEASSVAKFAARIARAHGGTRVVTLSLTWR